MTFSRWLLSSKSTTARRAVTPRLRIELLEDRLAPATLTVNSVANADTRDTVLTLREAIRLASGALSVTQLTVDEQAQVSGALVAAPNRDIIRFSIGPGTQTIAPTGTDLPEVAEPAEIVGTAPTAFPTQRIEISGQNFVGGAHTGIRIRGGDSILRGLTVNRFNVNQVHLITRGNNLLVGNHIGVNVAGDAAAQSGTIANGIYVDNTPDNTIGGSIAADRNVISGNANGIYILGAGSAAINAARNNRILGNFIGTDAAGDTDLGNASGVRVQIGHHNTIGGLIQGERNVISGNNAFGIILSGIGGAGLPLGSDNVIQGNYIGVNAAGTATLANSTGIHLGIGNRQLVGGTVPGAGNLIAGGGVGVNLVQTQDSRVQGNRIGTGPAGTEDWGSVSGIQISSTSTNNLVGGRDEDDGATDGGRRRGQPHRP